MAISLDLRRHAVEAYEQGAGSLDPVAARFAVGRASRDDAEAAVLHDLARS